MQGHCASTVYKETRVETYPFARDAVREAVFNALIHCNWADNVPVQIRIEDDAMYISNCSMLPFGWTVETLLSTHVSKPYNPDIARVFYRDILKAGDAAFRRFGMPAKVLERTIRSILFMVKILW